MLPTERQRYAVVGNVVLTVHAVDDFEMTKDEGANVHAVKIGKNVIPVEREYNQNNTVITGTIIRGIPRAEFEKLKQQSENFEFMATLAKLSPHFREMYGAYQIERTEEYVNVKF